MKEETKWGWICFAVVAVPFIYFMFTENNGLAGYLAGVFATLLSATMWLGRIKRGR